MSTKFHAKQPLAEILKLSDTVLHVSNSIVKHSIFRSFHAKDAHAHISNLSENHLKKYVDTLNLYQRACGF